VATAAQALDERRPTAHKWIMQQARRQQGEHVRSGNCLHARRILVKAVRQLLSRLWNGRKSKGPLAPQGGR
jgi:hypothetical protein